MIIFVLLAKNPANNPKTQSDAFKKYLTKLNSFFLEETNEQETKKEIYLLKNKKSSGDNNINDKFLQQIFQLVSKHGTYYQLIFCQWNSACQTKNG